MVEKEILSFTGNGLCRHCRCPFGSHAKNCPVKYRDSLNPDPRIQRNHERMDAWYENGDSSEITVRIPLRLVEDGNP